MDSRPMGPESPQNRESHPLEKALKATLLRRAFMDESEGQPIIEIDGVYRNKKDANKKKTI